MAFLRAHRRIHAQARSRGGSTNPVSELKRRSRRGTRRWAQQRITTVYGFSEMKRVTYWAGIVARRDVVGGLAMMAVEFSAGAAPLRFDANVASVVEDAVSTTSTQGPQWDEALGIATLDAE